MSRSATRLAPYTSGACEIERSSRHGRGNPEFQRRAKSLLSEGEIRELVAHVAANPLAGVAIGAGVRKFRRARGGEGERGGYRDVDLFVPDVDMPIFLLTIFANNEKSDLTPKEVETIRGSARELVRTYRNRR